MNANLSENILGDLWREVAAAGRAATFSKAKADPQAHKLTKIMDEGKSASWRYWSAAPDGLGRQVRFCWSCNRNAAGYFLGWREVVSKNGTIKRDRFLSRKLKHRVREIAAARRDAWNAKRVPA